ncbi:class I SAM-dependent methyltransferase [Amycolatopsis cihanbeyliensis]|uniref:2-polyprenyl-3-methyl-5-hydroxy-6-metoxy-1, 4-benzoquinol methylase n=1 Tax=Amycolatopsis cihanbeyliensis TaxID=1128664 RepID=A0A542DLQ5_AMYCI|nr:class I SAM-dependent methyltransferase [Amycolatopsis cihanbeyliensis]TQJ04031.1 2-polyprenyl-3-methyl-5-hydroxy-6-metoxy-1,4-benzoquinol methylase [Amycolatopsis cihanbeyliensis]
MPSRADGVRTEQLVGAIVAGATDRSSMSDELHSAARDWAERRHLDRSRANLLRALDWPAGARVLHLGRGAGALTRYLAEHTGSVLAMEPTSELARIATAWVGGLDNVRVELSDPLDPAAGPEFDLVVATGVLEPLAEPDRQLEYLRTLRGVLRPGGMLCLAVENQFGARNLAGAPQPHSRRRWDAVEGYPFGTAHRAPSRRALESLLDTAGFTVQRVLGCFPDHQFTNVVLSAELLARYPRLAVDLPRLPSEDPTVPGPRPVDEARLWKELVAAGLGADAWNSFLVLAGVPGADPPEPLWPPDRLATYFNTDRAARWCTGAHVVAVPGGAEVRRRPLLEPGSQDGCPVSIQPWSDPVHDGPTMVAAIHERPWLAEDLLRAWHDLIRERAGEFGDALWDLLPRNIVVTADGRLHPIDLEWRLAGTVPDEVVERGLLLTAEHLASLSWPGAGSHNTVRDLAGWLGRLLHKDISYVERAVTREARFQTLRWSGGATGEAALEAQREEIAGAWYRRLDEHVPVSGDTAVKEDG